MGELLKGGVPGFCMVALAMVSNCFLNAMLSSLGSEAVAGIGVVRKIDQLAYAVNQGITQGMLPLVAYCYAAGKQSRMKQAVFLATAGTEVFSLLSMIVSLTFAPELISVFIREQKTIQWGTIFLRVLCLALPIYTLTFVIIAVFQAVGRGVEPLVLSILHKGSLDILLLFFIGNYGNTESIVWATPISETVALVVAFLMLGHFYRLMTKDMTVVDRRHIP